MNNIITVNHEGSFSDGNRVISIRIKEKTLAAIDDLANEAGYSRNELINIIIEHGLDHCELI